MVRATQSTRHFITNSSVCCRCGASHQCSICEQTLPLSCFPPSQLANKERNVHFRCTACHVCSSCHTMREAALFSGDEKQCVRCEKRHECSICEQELSMSCFPPSQLEHKDRNVHFRCTACHVCSSCHTIREAALFRTIDGKECVLCTKTHDCSVCQRTLPTSGFPPTQLKNSTRNVTLRCTACHICRGCQKPLSALAFKASSARCKACVANVEYELRSKERRIQRALKAKDAWRCTCHKVTHSQRCQLFPVFAGERRWRGKNKGVTLEDLEFLAQLQKTKSGAEERGLKRRRCS